MNTLERARPEEFEICYGIICEGRAFQQEQGFVQWTNAYPGEALIRQDLAEGSGYLFKLDGQPAGYMYISFDGDPSYDELEGAWRSNGEYAVVHRIALSRRFAGKGLSSAVFEAVAQMCREKGVSCIRIDTDAKNGRMQHVLEKNGFVRCGYVLFEGDRKLAYDKLL